MLILLCFLFSALGSYWNGHEYLTFFAKAIVRAPSYVGGLYLGKLIKEKEESKLNICHLIIISFLAVLLYNKVFPKGNVLWLMSLPTTSIATMLLKYIPERVIAVLKRIGTISLESYLTNVYLGDLLNHRSWRIGEIDLSYGHYIEYLVVVSMGLLVAYYAEKIDVKITNGLKSKL